MAGVLPGLLWGCLLQGDPVRSLEALTMANAARARAEELHRIDTSDPERRRFEEKFNRLIDALRDFTDDYNRSAGNVWPAKKAEAVNKAFRDLEQTRSWRAADQTAGGVKPSGKPPRP